MSGWVGGVAYPCVLEAVSGAASFCRQIQMMLMTDEDEPSGAVRQQQRLAAKARVRSTNVFRIKSPVPGASLSSV
jgi:hypothetical protein